MDHPLRLSARLCWAVHARQGLLVAIEIVGASLFVFGCIVFYAPAHYTTGVTLFLIGSILLLAAVSGRALLMYGPSE